jgi:hypothetical protein
MPSKKDSPELEPSGLTPAEELLTLSAGEEIEEEGVSKVRLTFTLTKEDYHALRMLAQDNGDTLPTYIRKAFATQRYVLREQKVGGEFFLRTNVGAREIEFQ